MAATSKLLAGSSCTQTFRNYLSSSFEAYLKTIEEFDKRLRGLLEMTATAPQMWEKFIPGAEAMQEFWGVNKQTEEEK